MEKQYYVIRPAQFKLDGGAMFGIIPRPLWEKKTPPDELNRIDLALRLWLIRTTDRVVLVDTGIGDYHGEKFDRMFAVKGEVNPLARALNSLGLQPEDITDLVLSHLHFDHVGGLIAQVSGQTQPVFPTATIHLHREHYNYSLHPTARDTGSFHSHLYKDVIEQQDQAGKVHWLAGDEGAIIPELNLNFLSSNGHTPHMIHPYDENFIYLADIVPTSAHVPLPWVMGYDIAAGISVTDKQRILNFVMEKQLTVIYEHDPKYWGSTIERNEKGYKAATLYPTEKATVHSIAK